MTPTEIIFRMEEALALIISARSRCMHVPELLAISIDAAEAALFATRGRIVSDSPATPTIPPGGAAAAARKRASHAPRRSGRVSA